MSRRNALIAFLGICLFVPACARVDKRVNKANFDKIKPGMTRDDVEAFLGYGEDYQGSEGLGSSAASVGVTGGLDMSSSGTPALRWVRWGNDYTYILVCFNRANKVHDNEFKKEKGLK